MRADDPEAVVLYAEVPGFYAEVERRADPGLSGRPILVGGHPAKRGKVQAASPEAIAAGVEPGMPMDEALRACPGALRRPTHMKRCREVGAAFVACLRKLVDALEPAALGAVYAEVQDRGEPPERLAAALRARVAGELGLPLRVGIGPSKLLARLAAEEAGAGGVRRVRRREVGDFLAPLALTRLPRVGRKTAATLHALGAATVGELRGLDPALLERELGNHGLAILALARGEDRSPIRVARHPVSISREQVVAGPGREALGPVLERLSGALELALARQGLRARRVAIRLRLENQTISTRSTTLGEPVFTSAQIQGVARSLLDRQPLGGLRVRAIGITLAGLAVEGDSERQLDLFPS